MRHLLVGTLAAAAASELETAVEEDRTFRNPGALERLITPDSGRWAFSQRDMSQTARAARYVGTKPSGSSPVPGGGMRERQRQIARMAKEKAGHG